MPFDLRMIPKYAKIEEASIMKIDSMRIQVIDEMLTNLYTVYVLLLDRSFYDAFVKIFINISLAKEFNEFFVLIKHVKILAMLLIKLERQKDAIKIYEFLRDLAEDTQNNDVSMDAYESLGKLLQERGDNDQAIVCFKKMLQLAWAEDDMQMETRAY